MKGIKINSNSYQGYSSSHQSITYNGITELLFIYNKKNYLIKFLLSNKLELYCFQEILISWYAKGINIKEYYISNHIQAKLLIPNPSFKERKEIENKIQSLKNSKLQNIKT